MTTAQRSGLSHLTYHVVSRIVCAAKIIAVVVAHTTLVRLVHMGGLCIVCTDVIEAIDMQVAKSHTPLLEQLDHTAHQVR